MQQVKIDFKLIGSRLMKCRKKLGLSRDDLAEQLKLSSGRYYGQIETGHAKLTLEHLVKVQIIYNMSPGYILTGVGSMFLESEQNAETQETKANYAPMTDEERDLLFKTAKQVETMQKTIQQLFTLITEGKEKDQSPRQEETKGEAKP